MRKLARAVTGNLGRGGRFVLFAIAISSSAGAMDRAHFVELNRQAAASAKQKDWATLRRVLLDLREQTPGNLTPRWLLRMASVEVHLNNKAEALRLLGQFSKMGLVYDVAQDLDLSPLAAEVGFRPIAEQFKKNQTPVSRAAVACVIPQADLMPEDITYDSAHRSFVITSIRRHGLFRLRLPRVAGQACNLEEIALPAHGKVWPAMAVGYDRKRHALWMTASAMPDFVGVPKEDQGKTQLLLRDDKSGEILREVSPEEKGPTVFGDISLANDGTLYVTASLGGGIYRLAANAATPALEKLTQGFSPQTPAVSSDGKRLFVPDYPMGIAVVDLAAPSTTELTYLAHPDDIAVTGIDGLYLIGDSLIGIQNGTNPQRIMRFRLNQEQTAIVSTEVLEQSEQSSDSNHAVPVGNFIYILSNVGWNKVDDNGNLKSGEQLANPVLLRLRVPN